MIQALEAEGFSSPTELRRVPRREEEKTSTKKVKRRPARAVEEALSEASSESSDLKVRDRNNPFSLLKQ